MRLRFEVRVPADLRSVFAFHEDPARLAVLMAGSRGFRLLRHDGTIVPGSLTWVRVTIAAIVPVTMCFRHTIFEPPHRFAEEMVRGPFRRFFHVHEFSETEGGTVVTDSIDVALPLHLGGELVTRRLVAPIFRRSFAQRQAALVRHFGGADRKDHRR